MIKRLAAEKNQCIINRKRINIVSHICPLSLILFSFFLLSPFRSFLSLLCCMLDAVSLTFSLSASVSFSLQVDRLMELHFKYLEAVQQADKRIEGEKHVSAPFYLLQPF